MVLILCCASSVKIVIYFFLLKGAITDCLISRLEHV